MYPILVLGAGKIGASIAKLLHISGDYRVTVADRDGEALARVAERTHLATRQIDVASPRELREALDGQRATSASMRRPPLPARSSCRSADSRRASSASSRTR